MKTSQLSITTIIVFLLLCTTDLLNAQPVQLADNEEIGEYHFSKNGTCITVEKQQEIEQKIKENVAHLRAIGKLKTAQEQQKSAAVTLEWPLKQAAGYNDYGYHGIGGFVDHNPNANSLEDYNCGDRTYDVPSYNHTGTDYYIWPFAWHKVDNNVVEIVAAADGTIVYKMDGNPDENCSFEDPNWNAVFVQHSDGSTAWYGHMKEGSLTSKAVGSSVTTGEYLGIVASSGSSSGSHLHFEIRDNNDNIIDPYGGSCNGSTGSSWWADQRPYYDSGLNHLMTTSASINFPSCPGRATSNASNDFCGGDRVYFYGFFRDCVAGQSNQHTVYRPDNSVFQSWTNTVSSTYSSSLYWSRFYDLPSSPMNGIWRYVIDYEGETYEHSFNVCFTPTVLKVKAKVFLEGAQPTSGQMSTTLNSNLPSAQPYNTAPWNYNGSETVSGTMPSNIVDWVLVEASDANFNVLEKRAALLRNDGVLLDTDGTVGVNFSSLVTGSSYHLTIRHRNHLAVVSSNMVSLPNGSNYDFSATANVLSGNSQLATSNGIRCLHAGDCNADGIISIADFNGFLDNLSNNGYDNSDFSLDNTVSTGDFNLFRPNASVIGVREVRF